MATPHTEPVSSAAVAAAPLGWRQRAGVVIARAGLLVTLGEFVHQIAAT